MTTENKRKYDLIAPAVDSLLRYFDHQSLMNPTASTEPLHIAFEKLWSILTPLAPLAKNEEAKAIWIRIPRGTIEEYGNNFYSFEDAQAYGDVETYEEYEKLWQDEYPEDTVWYELTAVKSFHRDGSLRYYGITLGYKPVISALTEQAFGNREVFAEDAAIELCELILPAVQESIRLLQAGEYNRIVEEYLPYQFQTGVITRKELCEYVPEYKERDSDGLSEEKIRKFRDMLHSGVNDLSRIGRIKEFTANDFFNACKIGYEAIGKDCSGLSLPELYQRYADGRDEGLIGMGHGLNAGPGIDFNSSTAWNEWYYGKRGGGHPWEVIPGGNSTHMELYVIHDNDLLDYYLSSGKISQQEYDRKKACAGYYFTIAGVQRQFEAVSFYIALSEAGLPVILRDAEELLARFDATDYIGIVPHHLPTRYCEHLFPASYGKIIDFIHVDREEDPWFEKVEWLPEKPARLIEIS